MREDGSTARPWLTVIIDDYSRAIAGYYLGFEPPSVLRTSLALRQGIWRKTDPRWPVCGIPDVLYTDNGSDFTSRHIEQVAIDLRMQWVFQRQPRGRGRIERSFRIVDDMFLCTLDGYIGKVRRKPSLTLEQMDVLFRSFLFEQYQCTPNFMVNRRRYIVGRREDFYRGCPIRLRGSIFSLFTSSESVRSGPMELLSSAPIPFTKVGGRCR